MKGKKRSSGFTLLEISIVLVIIGLVVGGVMAGRSLIEAAQVRAQLRDVDSLNIAIATFKLKYSCLPGDCANATDFFNATSQPQAVTNGAGAGYIVGYMHSGGYPPDYPEVDLDAGAFGVGGAGQSTVGDLRNEWAYVYDHLAAANLINFAQFDETVWPTEPAGIFAPKVRFDTYCYAQGADTTHPSFLAVGYFPAHYYLKGGHYITLGGTGNSGSGGCSNIGAKDAQVVDDKIDDGKPHSGRVFLMGTNYIYRIPDWPENNYAGNWQTHRCANKITNQYISDSDTCTVFIKASFGD